MSPFRMKRWTKQKSSQQKAKKRCPVPTATGSGGTMSVMRKGFAGLVGGVMGGGKPQTGKPKGPAERVLDGAVGGGRRSGHLFLPEPLYGLAALVPSFAQSASQR